MRVAIIPARGGSKRIPRKNIKPFFGEPIIAYPIKAALQSRCFDRVIVSTDDNEIAEIARRYGAEVPSMRSPNASDDRASLHDVVVEVLSKLTEEIKQVALILPTSPLLTVETIQRVMHCLDSEVCDSVLTIVEYNVSVDKALSLTDNGLIVRQNATELVKRSQEHQTFYHDAGQMYAFYANDVKRRETLTGARCKAITLDCLECQDIDTSVDWRLAEMKYRLGNET